MTVERILRRDSYIHGVMNDKVLNVRTPSDFSANFNLHWKITASHELLESFRDKFLFRQ
jgi:hypothetical protein